MNGFHCLFFLDKNKFNLLTKLVPRWVYLMLDAGLNLNFPEEKAL
jgi:hypothetical protein